MIDLEWKIQPIYNCIERTELADALQDPGEPGRMGVLLQDDLTELVHRDTATPQSEIMVDSMERLETRTFCIASEPRPFPGKKLMCC